MVTAFAAEFWFVVSSSAFLTLFLSLFLCVFLWPMVFERRGDCEIFVSRNTCEMATAAPKFPKVPWRCVDELRAIRVALHRGKGTCGSFPRPYWGTERFSLQMSKYTGTDLKSFVLQCYSGVRPAG